MGSRCAVKKIRGRLSEIFGSTLAAISGKDINEARELIGNAKKASEIGIPYAESIALAIGLSKESVVPGPLKKLERIFEKAIGKHAGQLEEVPDVGRLRILIEKPEDVIALRRMFVERQGTLKIVHPNNKITVTEFQDNFWEPSSTGRVAIHIGLDIRLSGSKSVPYEIQVIHKDMVDTEKFTHNNYQRACDIERKAKGENRPLTADEADAIESYRKSNRERYLADSLNYNLFSLRQPKLRHTALALVA